MDNFTGHGQTDARMHVHPIPIVLPMLTSLHRPPIDHPEVRGRWDAACRGALRTVGDQAVLLHVDGMASHDLLRRVHDPAYLALLKREEGMLGDGETWCGAGSWLAAANSAAACVELIDQIAQRVVQNGLVLARPPGHHAKRAVGAGYCLLNNVRLATERARERGFRRVAVIDLDAHHGDGCEDYTLGDAEAFYASVHQRHLFPTNSGQAATVGAFGNVLNIPLEPGAEDADLALAMELIDTAVGRFRPDVILVAFGTDGHVQDPMSELCYSDEGLGAAIGVICRTASEACGGRVAVVLEGGYDYASLETGVGACVQALVDPLRFGLPSTLGARPSTQETVSALAAAHPHLRSFS